MTIDETVADLDEQYRDRPRPEQAFFRDDALDRALGVVFALAQEVWVLRDRLAAVERALEQGGTLDRAALDREPGDAERQAMAAERQAFVAGLMESLRGRQASKGVPD